MKKLIITVAIIITTSFAFALDLSGVLTDARRMCVNDSIPQALLMLDEQLKGNWSEEQKILLHIEKGDILLYYTRMPAEASKIYEGIVQSNPPKAMAGEVYYRLGLAYERSEKFADAARAYEKVVTDYSDSPYNNFALSAIERTFLKNYEVKAAEVNGYPISELEVEEISSRLSPGGQDTTPEARKALIERIIYERLLKVAAVEKFAPLDSTKITIHLNCKSCRPKDVMIPGHLQDRKLENRLAEAAKGVYLRRLYDKEVTERIVITDKERKRYYKDEIERFTIPAQYTIREIVTDSATVDSVLASLQSGMTFDSTAKLFSNSQTKLRGGALGTRPLHALPKEITPVAETLKVGSVSAPYKSVRGWEFALVEAKTEPKVNPYDQVINQIDDLLKRQKVMDLSKNAVERFRKEAGIDSTVRGDTLARVAGCYITNANLDTFMDDIAQRMPINVMDTTVRRQALEQMISNKVFDLALAQAKLFLEDSLSNRTETDRKQMMVEAYLADEIDAKSNPPDEEVKTYYNDHKKDFWQPAKVSVREMLIVSSDTLKMVQKMLSDSVSFDSLARTYSSADSKQRSGYIGYIEEGKSDKPYERQALKLKPGTVSKPIKTSEGYWLVKCENKKPEKQLTLEEATSEIKSILGTQKKTQLESALKERLMSTAVITISQSQNTMQPTLEVTPSSPSSPSSSSSSSSPSIPATPEDNKDEEKPIKVP